MSFELAPEANTEHTDEFGEVVPLGRGYEFEEDLFEDVSILRVPAHLAEIIDRDVERAPVGDPLQEEEEEEGEEGGLELQADCIVLNGRRYPYEVQQLAYPVEAMSATTKIADVSHLVTVSGKGEPVRSEEGGAWGEDAGGAPAGGAPAVHPAGTAAPPEATLLLGGAAASSSSAAAPQQVAGASAADECPPNSLQNVPEDSETYGSVFPLKRGLTNVKRVEKPEPHYTQDQIEEAWLALVKLMNGEGYTFTDEVEELDKITFTELQTRHRTQIWTPSDNPSVVAGGSADGGRSSGRAGAAGASSTGAKMRQMRKMVPDYRDDV